MHPGHLFWYVKKARVIAGYLDIPDQKAKANQKQTG
jgi:hypothetical protein